MGSHRQMVVVLQQKQVNPCYRCRMLGSLRQQQQAMLTYHQQSIMIRCSK
jgi:hypothetical protein